MEEINKNYQSLVAGRKSMVFISSNSECSKDRQNSYGRWDRNYYIGMGFCAFSLLGGAIATVPCVAYATINLMTCYSDAEEDYVSCVKRATTTISIN